MNCYLSGLIGTHCTHVRSHPLYTWTLLYVMEVGLKALRDSLVESPPPPVNSILSRVEYTVLQSELRKRCFSLIAY